MLSSVYLGDLLSSLVVTTYCKTFYKTLIFLNNSQEISQQSNFFEGAQLSSESVECK
jgi:hypothetical protein